MLANLFSRLRRQGQNKLFLRYLAGYVLLLIPMLCFVPYAIGQLEAAMIDGYGKQERVAVEKTCASLDAMVLQIMHIQSSMGENPAFSPVRSFSPTRAVSLLEELRKYHLGFYDMQILGLYYYEDSYIYLSSSTYRLDLFLDTYQYDALTKEQWRKALNKGEQIAIYPAANLTMQGLSQGRQILFLLPFHYEGQYSCGVVLTALPESTLLHLFGSGLGSQGIVLNALGEVVAIDPQLRPFQAEILAALSPEGGQYRLHLQGQEYIATDLPAANGLRCVSLLPTSQFLHQITREQRAMYGILALILLASGVIISLLISKQYVPLKRFLQTVSDHMDAKEGTLDEAESMLLRLARENERLHSERLPPEERCVSLLLRGHPPESEEQHSLLEGFAAGACACAIAAVPSSILCEELRARVHQAFAPFCALLHLDAVSGRVVMLISLAPAEEEACRAALARAHALLRAAAQQTVALGVGSLQKEWRGLAASYMDAVSALECSRMQGKGKMVFSDEVVDVDDLESIFPYKEMELLRAHLRMGDIEAIHGLLMHILEYAKSLNMSLHLGRFFCYELANQVLSCVREMGGQFARQLPDNINAARLADYHTIDEMIRAMQNMMTNLCRMINEEEMEGQDCAIGEVQTYIRENACDINFSLQATASHFHMSLANLCQRFKEETGRTVLEYATEIRIERAKELLLTTRMTVREISEALGYSTSSSFIRRFKQITGETPREFGKRAE